jgi:hypothetical protein
MTIRIWVAFLILAGAARMAVTCVHAIANSPPPRTHSTLWAKPL